ncbi:MATE family efflux transporter [Scatolibacter rhodanostii]|uniref:MATE family efflux transporter n=1 Tax=Scatolibacter rhodanostii TaxID=2014781 RepID=UPI000C07F966|nr:MATE family efflux transporter [Scatolibacter rhodanostii]
MFSNKSLRNLIVPLIIEQFLAVTIGIANTAMVSSVGEAAVSGVSLVDSINLLLINLFSSIATGGAVVASQYLGKGERWNANKIANQLEYFSVGASLLIAAFAIIFRDTILQVVFRELSDEVMQNARIYFLLSAISYPFLAVYNAGAALFRSMGNSKISMLIAILMNIINISISAVGIYMFNLGVMGAALASLCARIVGSIVITILLLNPNREIYLDQIWKVKIHLEYIKKIMKIGIPSGLENSVFQLGKILTMSIVSSFGTAAITANAVAGNLSSIQIIPGSAIGMAMLTIIGQSVGARDIKGAKTYTKRLMIIAYVSVWITTVAIFLSKDLILGVYNLSTETTDILIQLFLVHAFCCVLIWPLSFTLPNALRAAGDAKFTMITSLLSMWIFRIAFSYILAFYFDMNVFGIWVAMCIDWLFRSICFIIRFARGKWQNHRLV